MSEQRQNEWKILEESALRSLSNPEPLGEDRANLLLRLWQYPAFERYKVWAVFVKPGTENEYLIQRIIWNRPQDSRRLSAPLVGLKYGFHATPSISTKVKIAAADAINPCIEELLKINIPPFVAENNLGLDGIGFGFEFRKFTAQASFSWWCEAPTEWQMLEKWFLKTKNFLDTQFAVIL